MLALALVLSRPGLAWAAVKWTSAVAVQLQDSGGRDDDDDEDNVNVPWLMLESRVQHEDRVCVWPTRAW